jgi:outer membrane protein assembly factor BamB
MDILSIWPAQGLPRLWKQPIGGGYASFVAAGGRAFTIEQRRGQEVVAAYDIETGRELWTHTWDADFRESMGGDGPRATPTWHEGRLYALGAVGELRCLDARSGKLVWNRNILSDAAAGNLQWYVGRTARRGRQSHRPSEDVQESRSSLTTKTRARLSGKRSTTSRPILSIAGNSAGNGRS